MAKDYRPYDERNFAQGSSREEKVQQMLDRQIERQPRMPQTLVSYLINKTGSASVKGEIVKPGSVAFGFIQAPANEDMPIGVVMDAGIPANAEGAVAVGGRAQVLLKDGVSTAIGDVLWVSSIAGRADAAATIPAAEFHFREIGHALEAVVGGTDKLVWVQLHFN